MSASLVLRSAGSVVRRPIPRGFFHQSSVRLLSGGAGRVEPNEHLGSKPSIGHTKRFEDGHTSFCRGAEHQKEMEEIASEVRVMRDKLRAMERTVLENDRLDTRRERVLLCACVLLVAFWVFS